MKLTYLFRNRWLALVWAAGIVWMALDFANPGDEAVGNKQVTTDVTGSAVSNEQVESILRDL